MRSVSRPIGIPACSMKIAVSGNRGKIVCIPYMLCDVTVSLHGTEVFLISEIIKIRALPIHRLSSATLTFYNFHINSRLYGIHFTAQ